LVGTGRIDFSAFVDTAREVCGGWPALETGRLLPPTSPQQGFKVISKETATQEYVIQMAAAPSAMHDDRYAAKVLSIILGDDTGSRLYWKLVDPGHAEQASIHYSPYHDAGGYLTYLSCDPDFISQNIQAVLDLYRQAEIEGVTEAELAQAKTKIKARAVLGSERPRGRLFVVGSHWTYRHEYRSLRDDLAAIDAVTIDQIGRLLREFPLSRNTTFVVGPLAEVAPPN
jgi:predicted Zn-dependent peptidase